MKAYMIVGIVMIVAGILALAYGGFTYTRSTSEANLGPLELTVKDRETINVPIWAGVGAIVLGGGMLLFPTIKQKVA